MPHTCNLCISKMLWIIIWYCRWKTLSVPLWGFCGNCVTYKFHWLTDIEWSGNWDCNFRHWYCCKNWLTFFCYCYIQFLAHSSDFESFDSLEQLFVDYRFLKKFRLNKSQWMYNVCPMYSDGLHHEPTSALCTNMGVDAAFIIIMIHELLNCASTVSTV